jgi:hypothetical protein
MKELCIFLQVTHLTTSQNSIIIFFISFYFIVFNYFIFSFYFISFLFIFFLFYFIYFISFYFILFYFILLLLCLFCILYFVIFPAIEYFFVLHHSVKNYEGNHKTPSSQSKTKIDKEKSCFKIYINTSVILLISLSPFLHSYISLHLFPSTRLTPHYHFIPPSHPYLAQHTQHHFLALHMYQHQNTTHPFQDFCH